MYEFTDPVDFLAHEQLLGMYTNLYILCVGRHIEFMQVVQIHNRGLLLLLLLLLRMAEMVME
jgi:hypothetical protein